MQISFGVIMLALYRRELLKPLVQIFQKAVADIYGNDKLPVSLQIVPVIRVALQTEGMHSVKSVLIKFLE